MSTTWTSATCYGTRKMPPLTSSTSPSKTTVRPPRCCCHFLFLGFAPEEPKGLGHAAKWHFNKMLKDTNWLRWRSNLPLYPCGIVSVTFRLVFSGGSVTHLLSLSFWEEVSGFPHQTEILHPFIRLLVWWTPERRSIILQLIVTFILLIDPDGSFL